MVQKIFTSACIAESKKSIGKYFTCSKDLQTLSKVNFNIFPALPLLQSQRALLLYFRKSRRVDKTQSGLFRFPQALIICCRGSTKFYIFLLLPINMGKMQFLQIDSEVRVCRPKRAGNFREPASREHNRNCPPSFSGDRSHDLLDPVGTGAPAKQISGENY